MATLEEIRILLTQQGDDWREANRQLVALVRESTVATTTANELNRDLTRQLSGIKKRNLFDIFSQVGQWLFYILIIILLAIAVWSGRGFRFGNLELTATANKEVKSAAEIRGSNE